MEDPTGRANHGTTSVGKTLSQSGRSVELTSTQLIVREEGSKKVIELSDVCEVVHSRFNSEEGMPNLYFVKLKSGRMISLPRVSGSYEFAAEIAKLAGVSDAFRRHYQEIERRNRIVVLLCILISAAFFIAWASCGFPSRISPKTSLTRPTSTK